MRKLTFLLIAALLAGCTTLPDVPQPDDPPGDAFEYPPFLPIEKVTFESVQAAKEDQETEEKLEARVAGLKARASQLRNRPIE